MNKKIIIPLLAVIIILVGGVAYLFTSLNQQKQANKEMQELADLDKKEMQNEYEQFAKQYSEMKTQINNDSIVAQLTQEQMRTQQLLEELKRVKSSDAREIARLKKELATVRAVLRSYVLQIDSLNRLNQDLTEENTRIKGQYAQATQQIQGLNSEKASLSEKVAIAAQLDATNINMLLKNKRQKTAKKIKDCKTIEVSFSIARNVTAANGVRTFFVRITKPTGEVLNGGGTFEYENKQLTYNVSIFADGHAIGSRTFTFK